MAQITVEPTPQLAEVLAVTPKTFGDARGWFYESWTDRDYRAAGIGAVFVQDNQSYSKDAGILRGIHFQNGGCAQAKLVRCTRGAVLDVAVDLRRGSPTYARWAAVELSGENKRQLFIPRGFGHAFLTLTGDVEICYKADNYYDSASDRSIRWDDPEIGIDWPLGAAAPTLSDKDRLAPSLADSDHTFAYGG